MTIDESFAIISPCIAIDATFQGIHFRYAMNNGIVFIEKKHQDRFFYWLTVNNHFLLIHASSESKLRRTKTIGSSLSPDPL